VPLETGTKLGPYEITGAVGAGGMGEVYRARDTRLGRDVAIKVLPEAFAKDAILKERFEREAKTISSLNHPNICTLYDVGHQDGTDFLVMELLEGDSLAERLAKGGLPVAETLRIGIEMSDALERAHRQGIVHRDLKPGNIVLTKSGAKLLDFGLAKPQGLTTGSGSALSGLATQVSPSSPVTREGTVIGTFQYMSPEQVEGKEADARSDIFALGAVLYEMATGRRAFEGKSQISIASAILEKEPEPISRVQPMTPPALEHVVKTCLAKDPEERFQTAHDVKLQLRWISESGSQVSAAPVVRRKRSRERLVWAAALVLVAGIAAAGWLWKRSAWSYDAPIVTSILSPANAYFHATGNEGGPVVVSPDGRALAFLATGSDGKTQIWVRELDQANARPLNGTEGGKEPFWSPDSRSLGFFAGGKLKRIEVAGGPAVTVCDAVNARGGSWATDGTILFAPNVQSSIQRVTETGGEPVQVTRLDEAKHTTHRWPEALPDGKHFLYLAANHRAPLGEQNGVYWASADGKENKLVVRTVANAMYASGYLLYLRENTVMAQPFDPSSGTLSGTPTPVAEGVVYDSGVWRAVFSASQNGILAYEPGGSTTLSEQLEWRDRSGKQMGTLGEPQAYFAVEISHDGRRVVAVIGDPASDVWIYDLEHGVRTRFTFHPAQTTGAAWSPDDSRIALLSNYSGRFTVYIKASNGSGEETRIAELPSLGNVTDWSPDGKLLLTDWVAPETGRDVWVVPVGTSEKPYPLIKTPAREAQARFAPDGRWIVYVSNESGQDEVYVTPFPNVGAKWQVSNGGGTLPRWSRDGKELFFLRPDNTVMSAPVNDASATFSAGSPKALLKLNMPPGTPGSFAAAPDNRRILATASLGGETTVPLSVIANWTAKLKK
jgi:Tol biopolymer transport system component